MFRYCIQFTVQMVAKEVIFSHIHYFVIHGLTFAPGVRKRSNLHRYSQRAYATSVWYHCEVSIVEFARE